VTGTTDASPKVIATVEVGNDPSEVAVSPLTGAAYVVSDGNHLGNLVTVINGETNKVAAVIPDHVGSFDGPGGIAISPKTGTVYVANDISSTVSVISGKTSTVTASISFPDGNAGTAEVAVSPVTGSVYANGVTNGGLTNNSLGALWVSGRRPRREGGRRNPSAFHGRAGRVGGVFRLDVRR